MSRLLVTPIVVCLVLAGAAFGAVAWADGQAEGEIAPGIEISGIPVGGLTVDQALARLQREFGARARRPARLTVGDRTFRLTAAEAGVRVSLRGAVDRAHRASRDGSLLERGWRKLTGGRVERAERAAVRVDRTSIRSFVGSVHAAVSRAPVDAAVELELTSVSIRRSRPGRRLADHDGLARRLTAAFTEPHADRAIRGRVVTVAPKVTEDGLWDAQPVAVTVARAATTVRVFRRGKLERTYNVAVGEPKYPTPTGRFSVQVKQVNPPWNVPNSDWAGELAGQTIPGGDPRNPLVARWIGFNGAVGFHGTKSLDSLGRSASHGCVRMSPGDVIDLYGRVDVGTPVLVA